MPQMAKYPFIRNGLQQLPASGRVCADGVEAVAVERPNALPPLLFVAAAMQVAMI